MPIHVGPDAVLRFAGLRLPCALGRGGIRADKREGDGATPAGLFRLRRVLYRPDRLKARPCTRLPVLPLRPWDGWCDDPTHAAYNHPVRRPHSGHCESLWRRDGLYDVIVVLGHNDDPVTPGLGSAVFLHVAARALAPTEGCVALPRDGLLSLLKYCGPETSIRIRT